MDVHFLCNMQHDIVLIVVMAVPVVTLQFRLSGL